MRELKCPNCGSVFSVDEADYAAIVSQVKNTEFQQELDRRIAELHDKQQAELENKELKAKQDYDRRLNAKEVELSKKDAEIADLKAKTLDAAAIDALVKDRADLVARANAFMFQHLEGVLRVKDRLDVVVHGQLGHEVSFACRCHQCFFLREF